MDTFVVGFAVGLVVGVAVGVVLWMRERALTTELKRILTEERQTLFEQMRTQFAALSRDALSSNTDDFLKLAKSTLEQQTAAGEKTLEEKKKLIDLPLGELGAKVASLNSLIQSVEKQRVESHGALQKHLETNAQATQRLQTTTSQLREALANPQRRGQWGERMAEDVLRLAGFVEGVNYSKQQTVTDGSRPDFTFPLPGGRHVHMDAKFPLPNYLKVLDSADDASRAASTATFLKDVRSRIKEVATRSYIDPAQGTVDYVLVFIPNEQIYSFIHEHDAALLDDAIRGKVVLCSPLTLYAFLSVIRQAAESYRVEQGSHRILELLAEFRKQWIKFVETMDKVGKRIDDARKEYEELATTRTRTLDRQLDKIEDLRAARLPAPSATADAGP